MEMNVRFGAIIQVGAVVIKNVPKYTVVVENSTKYLRNGAL